MNTWTLIQIVFDLFMACGLFVVVMRMNRAPKDDPRLSRGLALLQSKISVLEDLSDRTEQQVSSLVSILENKAREVQAKVELADRHVNEIRVSMERSLEVASIFQDKIPHKEIIERQNTLKYVTAARLAHSGLSVDEIAARVDLPRGELEFVASVNRDRLMFDEDSLPEWAKTAASGAAGSGSGSAAGTGADTGAVDSAVARGFGAGSAGLAFEGEMAATVGGAMAGGTMASADSSMAAIDASNEERARRLRAEIELAENQRLVESLSRLQFEMQNLDMQLARENKTRDLASAYEVPKVETDHLKKLGEEFRKAVREGEAADARQSMFAPIENLASMIPSILDAADQIPGASTPARAATAAAPIANVTSATTNAAPVASAQTNAAPSAQPMSNAAAQRAAAHQTPTASQVKDPILARAAAQAKVQAALRASAKPAQTQQPSSTQNTDLANARAVARSAAAPTAPTKLVRKVTFPRIDGSDV